MNTYPIVKLKRAFYGIKDINVVRLAIDSLFENIVASGGFYAGDNLITFSKSLGFVHDAEFYESFSRNASNAEERGALWRYATLVWAARTALRVPGDFVECGCYKGTSARIIAETVGFGGLKRHYYLYDLFDHDPSMPHHSMPAHSKELVASVEARFSDMPNTTITQGRVPDSLAVAAPQAIAFMHLDLNNAEAEIGALEVLFDRISPGGVLILDDFGWLAYQDQWRAETDWLGKRGYHVLEMPTGQGLVLK